MNGSPKYVVSATLQNADWNNSTILGAYELTDAELRAYPLENDSEPPLRR
jgi:hypothetical protein